MSMQPELQSFDAPVLWIEARYGARLLCAQVLSTRAPRGFMIGAARRADAPVDPRYLPAGLPANDNHTLVEPRGGGFVIHLSPAMRAQAQRSSARLRIPCGEVVFDISAAAPPPSVPRTWARPGLDAEARITGAVALGTLLLLMIVRAVPADPHALSLDDVGKTFRMSCARVVPPVPVAPEPIERGRGPAAGGGAPTARAGATGAAGDPKARRADARRATKGPAERQEARDVEAWVRSTGMLSILSNARTHVLAEIFDDTPALGGDAASVLAHLDGPIVGSAFGVNGLGPIGTGIGGADTNQAMIGGPGGLRTLGLRRGSSGPGFDDRGGGPLGTRTARAPLISTTPPVVRGGLDKEIVRRVVRQHLNEVRFCYEQALARTPTLAGRVVAAFTIAPNGTVLVSALQSSSLGAPTVDACIVAATRRWMFPQPLGGGLVAVSYPFQLAPAGG